MKKLFLALMLLAPMATFAQKFGYVNTQDVMQSMPEFIKARGELEATAKQYDNDLKAMQDEIQRKSDTYDKTKSTMNPSKQQETETELQQLYQKYQQALQDNQQALQKAQQEKMQPITTKVQNAILNVGKAGNYTGLVEGASQGGVLYSSSFVYMGTSQWTDVTEQVKAEVNKMK